MGKAVVFAESCGGFEGEAAGELENLVDFDDVFDGESGVGLHFEVLEIEVLLEQGS